MHARSELIQRGWMTSSPDAKIPAISYLSSHFDRLPTHAIEAVQTHVDSLSEVETPKIKTHKAHNSYRTNKVHAVKGLMICLHQTPSSAESYRALISALRQLDPALCVVALDTHGFGESLRLPHNGSCTIEALATPLAEAVRTWMDVLSIDQVHLCGHHTGATLALELSHQLASKVASLLLIGLPMLPPHALEDYKAYTQRLRSSLRTTLIDEQRLIQSSSTIETSDSIYRHKVLEQIREVLRTKDPNASDELIERELQARIKAGEYLADVYDAVWAYDHQSIIQTLQIPLYLVAPTKDKLSDYVDFQYQMMIDAGINVHIDRPNAGGYVLETATDKLSHLIIQWLYQNDAHLGVHRQINDESQS